MKIKIYIHNNKMIYKLDYEKGNTHIQDGDHITLIQVNRKGGVGD